MASATVGGVVGGVAGASAATNEVGNNYLSHAESQRYDYLQQKKWQGRCDASCESEIKQLATTDLQRDTELSNCSGVQSTACDGARKNVRYAAAEYLRTNDASGPYSLIGQQQNKTEQLAQDTLEGVRLGTVRGFGKTVADGFTALASGAWTGLQAMLGEPKAQQQVSEGARAAYSYVTNAENWPYLLGAMTPDKRELLALAYERGDGQAVGRILGEQAANLPSGGGGLGTVKKIGIALEVAEDTEKLAVKVVRSPVDVEHVIGGDFNVASGRVTGGHSVLNGDVRVTDIVSRPDAHGVYEARVEIRTPDGIWVAKTSNGGINTMFPANWNASKIQSEVDSAWLRQQPHEDPKKWIGIGDGGITIEGYKEPRITGYPIYNPMQK